MVDAGELNERVEILRLDKQGKVFSWRPECRSWAKVKLTGRKNIFSNHGIGATGITFTMRRQRLALDNMLRFADQHCYITNIQPMGRLHITVEAALVEIRKCAYAHEDITFPAIMTEKYLKHDQLEPMAINSLDYVLVTPKSIVLDPGKLVRVDGVNYPVQVAHTLDSWKNEYELRKVLDL